MTRDSCNTIGLSTEQACNSPTEARTQVILLHTHADRGYVLYAAAAALLLKKRGPILDAVLLREAFVQRMQYVPVLLQSAHFLLPGTAMTFFMASWTISPTAV